MDPVLEYAMRRDRLRARQQTLEKRFTAIGNLRLVIGLGTAAAAWFVFARRSLPAWVLLLPVTAFAALVVWHQNVIRKRTIAGRAVSFYERGLARLKDEWAGRGNAGERFRDSAHIYAEDLDLFGRGGLFELVANTRTAAGEEKLALWLLYPARYDDILQRQAAVAELRTRLDLREDVALLGDDVRPDLNTASLGEWGSQPRIGLPRWLRPLGLLLATAGIGAVFGFFAQRIPIWPLILILGCDSAIIFAMRRRVSDILDGVEASGRDVKVLSALLARLEHEQFESPRLMRLRQALDVVGQPASKRIAKLGRLVDWLDSGDHVIIRILRPLLLWREQLAVSFENWRALSGSHIGLWVQAVAEFEALSSFAALQFERPDWTVPKLTLENGAGFEAAGLKHPLISSATSIPNDLTLNKLPRMLVVSGSNMSGKSTLLRAVGLNTVLASAGAPVAAASLRISPLQVGASIRINDSLQDHRSRFFAEISRIRQIVQLTKSGTPVLFLLDELLSGTNSHDRRIGAAGIVRELLRSDAIGLITTHDLALTNIQHDVSAAVANVHFEDQMGDGEMLFDYKLKPGMVTRSNALELMRAVGLEV